MRLDTCSFLYFSLFTRLIHWHALGVDLGWSWSLQNRALYIAKWRE